MVEPAGGEHRHREERGAHEPEDHEARDRPARNLRRQQNVEDEQRDRGKVEQAMREDGADERRARPLTVVGQTAAQHRHPRELARPRRQHRVSEQPDAEGREDVRVAWVRLRKRLVDRQLPRSRPRDDGEEVDEHREDHPPPGHDVERFPHGTPVGAAPPEREDGTDDERQPDSAAQPGASGPAHHAHAAARTPFTTSDV